MHILSAVVMVTVSIITKFIQRVEICVLHKIVLVVFSLNVNLFLEA